WDALLERDKTGLLLQRMNEVCDGELQNYKFNGGAYTREHFFGVYPELLELVADMSDEQIMYLNRGGHDPYKVYAAYAEATSCKGQPTVILAHTVKGYGLGSAGEAANDTHSVKNLDVESLRSFRDRFGLPIADSDLAEVPYYRPADDSPEMTYMRRQRGLLGGSLPSRSADFLSMQTPELQAFGKQLQSSGERAISTTMAFVRILSVLIKDTNIGQFVVPIVPDEARTFGMEGMFRQLGIYTSEGQKYTPHDRQQIMYYKEDKKGVILEEGINEAGAISAWLALATAYSTSACPMIPFYIFYSMFGFQRIGDLAWAAGDSQARGFLIGATAGRTTLNGEGLQHQDGHSHILANTVPNCRSYDATYSYELAVIIQHGAESMYKRQDNCFYYITTMNENYPQPAMPEGVEAGIIEGMYRLVTASPSELHVQLMGAGTILNEVLEAADILRSRFAVVADVWSLTSINQLVREGQSIKRWNLLHPAADQRLSYVERVTANCEGPVIIATDYMKNYAEQLRAFVSAPLCVLGTDGFGRSDSREALRHFFEVDRYFIVVSALKALADQGKIDVEIVVAAISEFGIDSEKPNPLTA
ncbi:MAG: pyruvate dehydrogenase (acetyl-transferring), homodimeric type, partial [Porticoccaceae bacterium]|nr:pyruvate dehydrogenase (acetyl-transferring), homodimeric type [Porticoccaceae bacterium]